MAALRQAAGMAGRLRAAVTVALLRAAGMAADIAVAGMVAGERAGGTAETVRLTGCIRRVITLPEGVGDTGSVPHQRKVEELTLWG